jgi:1,4-dihydroxy-2-naphthoate octaprenyltransferase
MSLSEGAVPSAGQIWWYAIRPRTLTMSVVPVLVGAVLAWHEAHLFRLLPFVAALVSALAIQIATNLLNDASDGESGLDRPGRLGPPRVTAQGWASAAEVRHAAMASFFVAAVAGVYCIQAGGLPILAIGLASLSAGWAYSRGPAPIAASAAGEVFVLVFFGIAAVTGTAWLMSEQPSLAAFPAGLLIGLPSSAVLLVNNHRDRDADTRSGRRTLAIVLGIDGTRRLFGMILVLAALLGPAVGIALDTGWTALTMLALPQAMRLSAEMARLPIGPELNGLLARTAGYQVVLAGLLCLGLTL